LTKAEIDNYFNQNWHDIQAVVKRNSAKQITRNPSDITSDIYMVCLEKKDTIQNLAGFIRIVASNIHRWERSSHNKQNKAIANDIEIKDIEIQEEKSDLDEVIQNRLFYLEKYKLAADPHELIFFDIFVNRNIRTIRALSKEVGLSHRGARTMINDFKQKIQNYERQEQAI
jgi:ribosomal protein S13